MINNLIKCLKIKEENQLNLYPKVLKRISDNISISLNTDQMFICNLETKGEVSKEDLKYAYSLSRQLAPEVLKIIDEALKKP